MTHSFAHSYCVGVPYLSFSKAHLAADISLSCIRCNTKSCKAEKNKHISLEVCLTCAAPSPAQLVSAEPYLSSDKSLHACRLRIQVESFWLELIVLRLRPEHSKSDLMWRFPFPFPLDGRAWSKTAIIISPADRSDGTRVGMMDE